MDTGALKASVDERTARTSVSERSIVKMVMGAGPTSRVPGHRGPRQCAASLTIEPFTPVTIPIHYFSRVYKCMGTSV